MQTILGIDPGSRFAGFGVIAWEPGKEPAWVDHGVIQVPTSLHFSEKLVFLSEALTELFAKHRPQHAVVEKLFLGKNADSAFKLGHVRGVCLLQAATAKTKLYEYAPRSVKKVVTGDGGASKEQVQLVLRQLLGLRQSLALDASDALALSVAHCRFLQTEILMDQQMRNNSL